MGRRITPEKRKCIEEMLAAGAKIRDVAKMCQVSTATVIAVKKALMQKDGDGRIEGVVEQSEPLVVQQPQVQLAQTQPPPPPPPPSPSRDPVADHLVEELNRKFYEKMRMLREDKRVPMLYKELQTLSWWHSVVHDVGVNTILLSLISSEIPEAEMPSRIKEWREDPGKLVDHVLEFLGKAVEYRRGAIRLMQLEEENKKLRNMVEGLKAALYQYMLAYNILASMAPDNIKLKFLVAYLVNQGFKPPLEQEEGGGYE